MRHKSYTQGSVRGFRELGVWGQKQLETGSMGVKKQEQGDDEMEFRCYSDSMENNSGSKS